MDKQKYNKGFTLIEMLVVLLIISLLMSIFSLKITYKYHKSTNMLINEIVYLQFEAIYENDDRYYDEYDMDIHFNRIGNVNHADSYQYYQDEIIVLLGTGRMYNRDEER